MTFLNLIKLLIIPVLFPLSILYSIIAYLNRFLSLSPYQPKTCLLSVGNIQLGGTGKTPIVIEIVRQLKNYNIEAVVISKSYKAKLKQAKEVFENDSALDVGDEALLIKKSLQSTRVFSGPNKTQTLKYVEAVLKESQNFIFVLDDGAQHHSLKKNIKIMVWDGSRSIFDIFSLPLGFSRESFFLSEQCNFVYLNRESKNSLSSFLKRVYKDKIHSLNYEIKKISNEKGEEIATNGVLISGVGNFQQLKASVSSFLSEKNLILKGCIKGGDHDTFASFKQKPEEVYICTKKDHDKLKGKVDDNRLFIVHSCFDAASVKKIESLAEHVSKELKRS